MNILSQIFSFSSSYLEWFTASGQNICIISYYYLDNPTQLHTLLPHVFKMVRTKRLDFVAKEALNLVLKTRSKCIKSQKPNCLQHMSQVEVVGFSFGAHVGARACKYIKEKTNEKVKILLGMQNEYCIKMLMIHECFYLYRSRSR